MAQFTTRLNVNAAQFPMISDQLGATVIQNPSDTYYRTPNQFSGDTADKLLGIPQLMFCENVMPTGPGFQSIGYTNTTAPFRSGAKDGDQIGYVTASKTKKRYLYNFDRQSGKFSIYFPELNAWNYVIQVPVPNSYVTVAHVQGRCFIYFAGFGYLYEFLNYASGIGASLFVMSSVVGITDLTPFVGIVSANNYLILHTSTAIYYTIPSSTSVTTPDFTPSLGPTGAATEIPSVLRGTIVLAAPVADGFVMFTSTSIIAAYYSGNIRFPWSYRELDNSAPIVSVDGIAFDREGYPKYAYTTGGILKLGKSVCTPQFPEAVEFLGGDVYEYYDWPTHSILRRTVGQPIKVGLAYVGGRWVILSYGSQGEIFTHALIWDEHLRRWGKISALHARAIEFFGTPVVTPNLVGKTYQDLLDALLTYQALLDANTTYADLGSAGFPGNPDSGLEYKSLGFMTDTGVVQVVNFDRSDETNQSIAMIGRVQLTRSHRFKITDIWSENFNGGPTTAPSNLRLISTKDMRNPRKITQGYVRSLEDTMAHHQFANAEGWNHTLQYEGDFNLSTIVVRGTQTGNR